jgi:predicted Fe-S protein YdhL (DUF1289 family)
MSYPPENVPSPCVKVCVLDRTTGLCRGCLRTVDEIAEWLEMTAEEKRATLERVEQRRAQRAAGTTG